MCNLSHGTIDKIAIDKIVALTVTGACVLEKNRPFMVRLEVDLEPVSHRMQAGTAPCVQVISPTPIFQTAAFLLKRYGDTCGDVTNTLSSLDLAVVD